MFNDALEHILFTDISLQTYGKGSLRERERRNPLPPHGLLFSISSKGSFIYIITQTG